MQLTEHMIDGFMARARRVIEMAQQQQEVEFKIFNGQRYVLAVCYVAALHTIDPRNFGLIVPDIDDLRRHCDADRLANLPAQFLNEPVLVMPPGVTILDGNHRIVKRWDAGDRLIPAYRLPDVIAAAALRQSKNMI